MKDAESNEIERRRQVSTPPVETALRRDARKQIPVHFPVAEQFRLDVPASAFTDESHGHQLAISTDRWRPRAPEQRAYLLPDVVDNHIHPRAKILEVVYHVSVLQCEKLVLVDLTSITPEDFLSIGPI
jgi:hypothetical protein